MNIQAIVHDPTLDDYLNDLDSKPKTLPQNPDNNQILTLICRLITEALYNDSNRINLQLGDDDTSFNTGTNNYDKTRTLKNIEVQLTSSGFELTCNNNCKVITYENLNFDYNYHVVMILQWIKYDSSTPDELMVINANRFVDMINKYLIDTNYKQFKAVIQKDINHIDIFMSGNSKASEFKVEQLGNGFNFWHIQTDSQYMMLYQELLENQDYKPNDFCFWLTAIVESEVNYEHDGYTILGLVQSSGGAWSMKYTFDNQLNPYVHTQPFRTWSFGLLDNMFKMVLHYLDFDEDTIDRDSDTSLPMLTYNQILGLKNVVTSDAYLNYASTAPNPLLHPDEVLNKVLVDLFKPLSDKVCAHIAC